MENYINFQYFEYYDPPGLARWTNNKIGLALDEMNVRMNYIINTISSNILKEDGEVIISLILPRTDHMENVKRLN